MDKSVNLNPSFSSTLLDSIYRSFDQCQDDLSDFRRATVTAKKLGGCTPLNRTKSYNNGGFHGSDLAGGNRRACHSNVAPRNSDAAAGFGRKPTSLKNYYSHSGGDVFSSETELSGGYGTCLRPKPIRTRISEEKINNVNNLSSHDHRDRSQQKPKHDGKFRAHDQNYGDLKRVNKTPISPAGKLAIFLNSLFTAKKTKSGSGTGVDRRERSSENASACSSASSFSRSCLSKHTPSSRINNAGKRTVTFFPVSVIIGEDCRPCGHKNLVNYDQKKVERESDYLKNLEIFEIEEDDLFELDNLSVIGKERYGEELPVYETTHLGNSTAIANGLLL